APSDPGFGVPSGPGAPGKLAWVSAATTWRALGLQERWRWILGLETHRVPGECDRCSHDGNRPPTGTECPTDRQERLSLRVAIHQMPSAPSPDPRHVPEQVRSDSCSRGKSHSE
ncbi:hypothetical protein H1C71_018464, partial [Ictidomys tridecemlineatus]